MASTLKKLEKSQVELRIQVDAADFKKAMEKAYQKNKRRFAVPGFRKGKAPMPIVMNYYGEAVLYQDAVDFAMDPAFAAALEEHALEPYAQPEIDVDELGLDKGLIFRATFAVEPELTLGRYKGLSAYKAPVDVSEEAIDEDLERARQRAARQLPVEDRPVQDGDITVIDYEGSVDGVPFEGGKGSDHSLTIGSGSFIPGFEEQLIGHEAKESFDITVGFPEDYHAEDLAGKEAVFHVTIKSIKVKEVPELDDEFIKDISEDYDTVEAYRKHLREEKEAQAAEQAERHFKQAALDAAVKEATVEIPEAAIREEAQRMAEEHGRQLSMQGLSLDQYIGYLGMSPEQYLAQLAPDAEHQLKSELLLNAVAKAEGLEVGEDDFTAHFEKLGKLYQQDPEELAKRFGEAQRKQLAESLLRERAQELIAEHTSPVDEDPAAKASTEEETADEDDTKDACAIDGCC